MSASIFKALSCASLLLFALGCTQQKNSEMNAGANGTIVGGKKVSANDSRFSGVVALLMVDKKSQEVQGLCTGTVITQSVVLTAAHCVTDLPENLEIMVSFERDVTKSSVVKTARKALKTTYHENYKPEQVDATHDIGLVKFAGGLPRGVQPVSLLGDGSRIANGERLVITGYGLNNVFLPIGSGVLRATEVKINDADFSPIEFGVKQYRDGVCSGDSGGPAFVVDENGKLVQAGITSRGFDFKVVRCIVSSYFTRVDKLADWIVEETRNLGR